jgi:hypothetical protein
MHSFARLANADFALFVHRENIGQAEMWSKYGFIFVTRAKVVVGRSSKTTERSSEKLSVEERRALRAHRYASSGSKKKRGVRHRASERTSVRDRQSARRNVERLIRSVESRPRVDRVRFHGDAARRYYDAEGWANQEMYMKAAAQRRVLQIEAEMLREQATFHDGELAKFLKRENRPVAAKPVARGTGTAVPIVSQAVLTPLARVEKCNCDITHPGSILLRDEKNICRRCKKLQPRTNDGSKIR